MSFATGVPASLDDFLSALVSFATSYAGFTNLTPVATSSGTGSRTVQRIQKNGVTWNFTRNTSNNTVQAAMSYTPIPSAFSMTNSGAATGLSTGQQYWTEMNTWAYTGPFVGHYFFTDGNAVHAVLEVAAGVFNHISFGNITKAGTWTGGEYLTGGWYGLLNTSVTPNRYREVTTAYSHRPFDTDDDSLGGNRYGYMRIASAGVQADFGRIGQYTGQTSDPPVTGFTGFVAANSQSPWSLYGTLLRDAPSAATNRTPLFPGLMRVRESVGGLLRVAGTVPYVALLRMSSDMNPKDIINTDWQVFPITCRTGGDQTLSATSYEYALAYRRV